MIPAPAATQNTRLGRDIRLATAATRMSEMRTS